MILNLITRNSKYLYTLNLQPLDSKIFQNIQYAQAYKNIAGLYPLIIIALKSAIIVVS